MAENYRNPDYPSIAVDENGRNAALDMVMESVSKDEQNRLDASRLVNARRLLGEWRAVRYD